VETDAITIPQLLSYQGKLTDTFGLPVVDTTYSVNFRLYTQPTGGSPFWSEIQVVRTRGGLFSTLLGSVTPIGSMPDAGAAYAAMAVNGGAELAPRLRIGAVAYAYLTERAANADLLQGRDTTAFSRSTHNHDATYVNEGQADAVTSGMIVDGTIAAADLGQMGASTGQVMKWTGAAWQPRNDSVGAGGTGTVTSVSQATGVVCTPNPITTTGTVGFDQTYGDGRYVNEGQADAVTSGMIVNGTIAAADLGQMGATTGQVMKWTGSAWAPRNDSVGAGGGGDNAWVHGSDSVLYTIRHLGIARGGAFNYLLGNLAYTHTNLGNACQTGDPGQNYGYITVGGGSWNQAYGEFSVVGGGLGNEATGRGATIGGGSLNRIYGDYSTIDGGYGDTVWSAYNAIGGGQHNSTNLPHSTVAGGLENAAWSTCAAVGGGNQNRASGAYSTIAGGWLNSAYGQSAVVAGGERNTAEGLWSTIGGGQRNYAGTPGATVGGGSDNVATYSWFATVAGGDSNFADDRAATVAGGHANTAFMPYSAVGGGAYNFVRDYGSVPGGYADTVTGNYAFATNNHSYAGHDNAAAFTGSHTTASNQVRAQSFSQGFGTFTMDHPADPQSRILNQYAVGSSELLFEFTGTAFLDGSGRATVMLPDYFEAVCRSPRVQLTGVGTSDVYVAEKVSGNRFAIGGKPGTEVYWTVTGERTDQNAELARICTPVEQQKTGELQGHSLDDDGLAGCWPELLNRGQTGQFSFRTAAGRRQAEDMARMTREAEIQSRNKKP
jgi:hypothetical protein